MDTGSLPPDDGKRCACLIVNVIILGIRYVKHFTEIISIGFWYEIAWQWKDPS